MRGLFAFLFFLNMTINLIVGVGDGYKFEDQIPFMNFLKIHGIDPIQIPLQEINPAVSYDDLRADNYCRFIDSFVDPKKDYWMICISKSCHWFRIYASKRKNIRKLIMIEPTTMNPRLLVEYEKSRDNYFITDYFKDAEEHEEYDADQKALDSIVSDNKSYFPKCPMIIIWSTKNNQDEFYSEKVLMLKREFEKYLKRNGCDVKVFTINGNHNLTLEKKNFELILSIMRK